MRVRKIKNLAEKLDVYRDLLVEDPRRIREHFDSRPVELEIGFGKGDFLLEMARRHPERNFLGIERSSDFALKAARKVGELDNVLFMTGNIQDIIPLVEDGIFSGLYLNFSDPWPKPRHYKRRLTYRELLRQYKRILKEGSLVQFKTDSEELFKFTLDELGALGVELEELSFDLHGQEPWPGNIITHYERKFSDLGKKIMGLRYRS